jgi:hypothetical protein
MMKLVIGFCLSKSKLKKPKKRVKYPWSIIFYRMSINL